MKQVTVKIPKNTYLAAKALAKARGCFIGRVFADALTLYSATSPTADALDHKPVSPKKEAA